MYSGSLKYRWTLWEGGTIRSARSRLAGLFQLRCVRLQTVQRDAREAAPVLQWKRQLWRWESDPKRRGEVTGRQMPVSAVWLLFRKMTRKLGSWLIAGSSGSLSTPDNAFDHDHRSLEGVWEECRFGLPARFSLEAGKTPNHKEFAPKSLLIAEGQPSRLRTEALCYLSRQTRQKKYTCTSLNVKADSKGSKVGNADLVSSVRLPWLNANISSFSMSSS